MTSNSFVPKPKLRKPRIQSRRRIASALTILTVPTWVKVSMMAHTINLVEVVYIDSLRIVTEPIAKVDTLDIEL